LGIAWHKALRALEREKRFSTSDASGLEELAVEEGASREDRDWLRRGLDGLSPEHRLVVELTFFLGCSYVEIAEIAGCPVNTVKTRMFHARVRLRRILAALDANAPKDRP
jgi:RNA polymerase sigma-70 factor (ECF subfamily)